MWWFLFLFRCCHWQCVERNLFSAASCELQHANTSSIRYEPVLPFKSLCQPHANGKWQWSLTQEPFVRISNADDVERWLSYLSWCTELCNHRSFAFKVNVNLFHLFFERFIHLKSDKHMAWHCVYIYENS